MPAAPTGRTRRGYRPLTSLLLLVLLLWRLEGCWQLAARVWRLEGCWQLADVLWRLEGRWHLAALVGRLVRRGPLLGATAALLLLLLPTLLGLLLR